MRMSRISVPGTESAGRGLGAGSIFESHVAFFEDEREDFGLRLAVRRAPSPEADGPASPRSAYAPSGVARAPAAVGAMLVVGGLLASLLYLNIGTPLANRPQSLVTFTVPLTPPPAQTRQQQQKTAKPPEPRVVAPPPIVAMPAPPIEVATITKAPSPPVVASAPAAPAPAGPSAAVAAPAVADGGDLSAKMISAKPPSYPLEARRRHEEGTVVLGVLVAVDGLVADIAVAQTSGSSLLDQAALAAVRKWRWAPLLRGGQPVMVQGQVKIPFVLKR